jgi:hypothetical protein
MVKNNMTKMKSVIKLIFPICLGLFLSFTKKVPQIVLPENSGQLEKMAARVISGGCEYLISVMRKFKIDTYEIFNSSFTINLFSEWL